MRSAKTAAAKTTPPPSPPTTPPLSAPQRFDEYLKKHSLTMAAAGKIFDCAPSYVTMLRHGSVTPGLTLASRIEKITGIECRAWVE